MSLSTRKTSYKRNLSVSVIGPPILFSLLHGKANKDPREETDRWEGRKFLEFLSQRFSFMRNVSIRFLCRSSIPLDCYNLKLERVRGDGGWQIQNERVQAMPRGDTRAYTLSRQP